MGVMACGRRGCEHILCEQTVLCGEAYICADCLDELKAYRTTWPNDMDVSEVKERIELFMNSRVTMNKPASNQEIEDEFQKLISS
jgi:hypothetical protein